MKTKQAKFNAKCGHGLIGNEINDPKTWVVKLKRTGEVLEYFRSYSAAFSSLSKWETIVGDFCEVVRNEIK